MNEYEKYTKARIKAMTWMIAGIILLTTIIFCMQLDGMDEKTIECIIYGSIGSVGFVVAQIAATLEWAKAHIPKSKLQLLEERVSELEKMVK